MKLLAVDCRMANMSGIGTYLRHLLPLCMEAMPEVRFRLLGYDGSPPLVPGPSWEPAYFAAPIYSLTEQGQVLGLLKNCDALWSPHYIVPAATKLPIVATVHDVTHLALPDLYTGVQHMYARIMFQVVRIKAQELLFVSEFSRREFARLVGQPRGNASVVCNGVDDAWLDPPLQGRSEPAYFLAVGNVKPHKNIRFLCHAFARIAEHCDAKLYIAGEHVGFRVGEESAETLAEICPGRIIFTGFIPDEELKARMAGAAALVFPSRYEGFGLPLLEAMAAGVPVLCSDTEVAREVCGDCASYFTVDSEEELCTALLSALSMTREERSAGGKAGRQRAASFTWGRAAEETSAVLRRVLGM